MVSFESAVSWVSRSAWLYLGAGANTQPPRPLRGSIPVLTRDRGGLPRGAVALCVPAVWVAVLPRQGNPLRDEFFPAQQVVFLQQLRRGGVHDDKLEGPDGGPYPGDHLLMALALHALSIDEYQAVAREEPGDGGGSIRLHEPDELPRLALLSVQVEPVAAGRFLQQTQSGSEVWHFVTLRTDDNFSPHYSKYLSHNRTHWHLLRALKLLALHFRWTESQWSFHRWCCVFTSTARCTDPPLQPAVVQSSFHIQSDSVPCSACTQQRGSTFSQ